jgi:3-hydroxyacyl-[acyl-carrier-protein] dehydratase
MLDVQAIMDIIPHRPPFLLVDRILEMESGKKAVGEKCVTIGEPFFLGHFPGFPVMPGVLIVEALAQVGAVSILSMPEMVGKVGLFGGIENARFRRQVVPGDVLRLEVTITKMRGPVAKAHGLATVDGETAVECDMTFAIAPKDR